MGNNQWISPFAGKVVTAAMLTNIDALLAAYYSGMPDPTVTTQQVSFGTSGHRGSSLDLSFNEAHVLAITQAICNYRSEQGIAGPLFLGIDTHALSQPACASALEVLAANGVTVMLSKHTAYTPTPAVSHAILNHNRGRKGDTAGLADGIIMTPSHNPPGSGGLKYNPPHGGPAGELVTNWIQAAANALLANKLASVKRMTYTRAVSAPTTHFYDFIGTYVSDLIHVVDMDAISGAKLHLGVDPMGGAGVHYWPRIAEQYKIDLTILNDKVDPQFSFMTADWDGRIRMDPSSMYAMQSLIDKKDDFDVAFACDTDHDRHGIVVPTIGHLDANHYLCVMIDELFRSRPDWPQSAGVGKTVVSSAMIDLVCARLGCDVFEVPVGFKWFTSGLQFGALGFAGEQSAGATFLRRDGRVWTTDKDGIAAALLAAEITALRGKNPGVLYAQLASELGSPQAQMFEAKASFAQRKKLSLLSPINITATTLGGQAITGIIDKAPGNNAPIGGIKVSAQSGWFAARPSGTEDLYKIYAESFIGTQHLELILGQAQAEVNRAIADQLVQLPNQKVTN